MGYRPASAHAHSARYALGRTGGSGGFDASELGGWRWWYRLHAEYLVSHPIGLIVPGRLFTEDQKVNPNITIHLADQLEFGDSAINRPKMAASRSKQRRNLSRREPVRYEVVVGMEKGGGEDLEPGGVLDGKMEDDVCVSGLTVGAAVSTDSGRTTLDAKENRLT